MQETKNPRPFPVGDLKKNWRRPTLPLVAVPSALEGLTSVFGMGTGEPLRYSHPKYIDGKVCHKEQTLSAPPGAQSGHKSTGN